MKAAAAVVSLSGDADAIAVRQWPELASKRRSIVPIPHYRQAYPGGLSRAAARRRLGLEQDGFLSLFFGLVRPYKGVPTLIAAFAKGAAAVLHAGRSGRVAIG